MANANIVHSGYGFRCTATDTSLPLTLGLDGSAVLERLRDIPDGWLVEALDQLFVAAPALTGITLPWAARQDEPQAQALFALASGDYLARETFWQLPLWLQGSVRRPAVACNSMRAVSFTSRSALTVRKGKSIAVTMHKLNAP